MLIVIYSNYHAANHAAMVMMTELRSSVSIGTCFYVLLRHFITRWASYRRKRTWPSNRMRCQVTNLYRALRQKQVFIY